MQGNIDLTGLGALDTSGASRLYELLGGELVGKVSTPGSGPARNARIIANRRQGDGSCRKTCAQTRPRSAYRTVWPGRAGDGSLWREIRTLLGFMGFTLEALGQGLFAPALADYSVVAQIETTGLDAVPIICLLNFLVGAVVAFLGATVLAEFGATIYTVNLVTFAFLRELAVLLTAILMAGRTASTFTAELGSMKVNEEIDATRYSA